MLQKKRIDILKPKLLATHPHPEEFTTQIFFEFQGAKIVFYLDNQFFDVFFITSSRNSSHFMVNPYEELKVKRHSFKTEHYHFFSNASRRFKIAAFDF